MRRILSLDALFVLIITALALTLSTTVGALVSDRLYLAAARNVMGYVGLMLIGRPYIGAQAASVLPVAYAFIAALFGSHVDHYRHTYAWAWPLADASDPISWILAFATLLSGLALALSRPVTQAE
ncbi:MAG TPA: hypothetical protein VKU87_03900 [Thermomicrobiaceae bacterium]|nr:hypothetical protein [Thermomicrobiaceae bacterium]